MARAKKAYVCSDCGAYSVKWQGQCPDCDAWNSLTQTTLAAGSATKIKGPEPTIARQPDGRLPACGIQPGSMSLIAYWAADWFQGSVVLLGGDPGVGKSTLLQQVAAQLPGELRTCYATGEESFRQIAERSHRLGLEQPGTSAFVRYIARQYVLEQASAAKSRALVIDSIQTMAQRGCSVSTGLGFTVARMCQSNRPVCEAAREFRSFLIGHVTKEGAIAGPRVVEHMVDTVSVLRNVIPASRYTIVRAVKNQIRCEQ